MLCALLLTYVSCHILSATSKNLNIATNAALGMLEQIRSTAFNRIYDDYNGLNFTVNGLPQSLGVVYVNDDNPELLKVAISISWRQGNRIIGADKNLNGIIDGAETDDGDGIIDSPVQLITRIANR